MGVVRRRRRQQDGLRAVLFSCGGEVLRRSALRSVAPELAESTIEPRGLEPQDDPLWWGASAVVDGRYVVKFAWAEPPARRICHQARVLKLLPAAAPRLPLSIWRRQAPANPNSTCDACPVTAAPSCSWPR
ncbi:hypothetical protein [Actinoplanes sp. M2I2]|uniref:hypothetical protein n=1 Tax=Actinoplanes sp. M2I2 TaxID=1734444 RepID=UPI0020228C5A|nr:hypothetical protein [Actinoplanes sp. M2I2]